MNPFFTLLSAGDIAVIFLFAGSSTTNQWSPFNPMSPLHPLYAILAALVILDRVPFRFPQVLGFLQTLPEGLRSRGRGGLP